ncbi:hypothetical protein KY329_02660 [Candidatus Woesearchaeota archaeon]|nr:hypothetical protein [Candidatus Woesearchaeota archaeon]
MSYDINTWKKMIKELDTTQILTDRGLFDEQRALKLLLAEKALDISLCDAYHDSSIIRQFYAHELLRPAYQQMLYEHLNDCAECATLSAECQLERDAQEEKLRRYLRSLFQKAPDEDV